MYHISNTGLPYRRKQMGRGKQPPSLHSHTQTHAGAEMFFTTLFDLIITDQQTD